MAHFWLNTRSMTRHYFLIPDPTGTEKALQYVSNVFEASVTNFPMIVCEALRVQVGGYGWDVCTVPPVHHAPSGSLSAFIEHVAAVLPNLPSKSLVIGDTNIDLNPKNDLDCVLINYDDLVQKQNFCNVIQSPTKFRDKNQHFRLYSHQKCK